jgi:hypothetical protein
VKEKPFDYSQSVLLNETIIINTTVLNPKQEFLRKLKFLKRRFLALKEEKIQYVKDYEWN